MNEQIFVTKFENQKKQNHVYDSFYMSLCISQEKTIVRTRVLY